MQCVFCHADVDIYIPFGNIVVCPRCASTTEIRKLVTIGAASYVGADVVYADSVVVSDSEPVADDSEIEKFFNTDSVSFHPKMEVPKIAAAQGIAYTSYFANAKNIPSYYTPIAICATSPRNWQGPNYRKLAPPYDVLMAYKNGGPESDYIHDYNERVLSTLDPVAVWNELMKISCGTPFVLLCYEKRGQFCHRHLVAEWFNNAGYNVSELD